MNIRPSNVGQLDDKNSLLQVYTPLGFPPMSTWRPT